VIHSLNTVNKKLECCVTTDGCFAETVTITQEENKLTNELCNILNLLMLSDQCKSITARADCLHCLRSTSKFLKMK